MLNCLRPLPRFNATFPPNIKGKTLRFGIYKHHRRLLYIQLISNGQIVVNLQIVQATSGAARAGCTNTKEAIRVRSDGAREKNTKYSGEHFSLRGCTKLAQEAVEASRCRISQEYSKEYNKSTAKGFMTR